MSRRSLKLIDVRPRPGHTSQGQLIAGNMILRCALGNGGITALKREGDGGTPLTRMRLLYGFKRPDKKVRGTRALLLKVLRRDDGWCEVSNDRNYNRKVRIPYGASHETMWRKDDLYDICIVMDWNVKPRRRAKGSAIFFHLARPGYTPTEGCIALSRADMNRLLPHLSNRTIIRVLR
ncbi:L,D-peptidoglycan transpeptidase YkuD (ErfK/YbiS/YcfS/YnhG family) [Phyllobacterium sp. 1468]|uniref:L,D-transpeptidase family protein n=1 Tax=Phyllobacterium sp. 1468 TaxID=2817759 RepID=UPI0028577630|nr:L,D-transpeptidase family protein [Phyllobacterium sp. 1468]MDR6631676.1 L,D-peptidoglycan transpeptidase YkuD (ErfK/YbiS/YcfS/YnhG family) [Phyllobacterium sp. 1468]